MYQYIDYNNLPHAYTKDGESVHLLPEEYIDNHSGVTIISNLEIAKNNKRLEMKHKREEMLIEGFKYDEFLFATDSNAREEISKELEESETNPKISYYWKDKSGESRLIGDIDKFKEFANSILNYDDKILAKENEIQQLIAVATTLEELSQITAP
jgi:hypothetical protein